MQKHCLGLFCMSNCRRLNIKVKSESNIYFGRIAPNLKKWKSGCCWIYARSDGANNCRIIILQYGHHMTTWYDMQPFRNKIIISIQFNSHFGPWTVNRWSLASGWQSSFPDVWVERRKSFQHLSRTLCSSSNLN